MGTDSPDTYAADLRDQLDVFIDEYRAMLLGSLDGLTEEEARCSLVPSKTTLLSLLKHGVFVERVWFEEAFSPLSRAELGMPTNADDSFDLSSDETIESVRAEYLRACDASRRAIAGMGLDDEVPGNKRGPLPLRWILLHVLRELAQHCGHAEILREQILARRGR